MIQIVALAVVIVAATVVCVLGVRRFNQRSGLDRYFAGEVLLTLAYVIPEFLIATHALLSPGRLPKHGVDPFLSVGAIMGSAAANVLIIGLLNALWPGRCGLEVIGSGRPLASAAVMLLVACVSFAGLAAGAGQGISMSQLAAGVVVTLVLLLGLRLVQGPQPKEGSLELDFRTGGGSLIAATVLVGVSVLALTYATPYFVQVAMPWLWPDQGYVNARAIGLQTILIGLLLGVPDFLLAVRDSKTKGGESPTPRLFLSNAALFAFMAVAGMDNGTLGYGTASRLFSTLSLMVFVATATVILLLATPVRVPVRVRGLAVTAIALAGLVSSVMLLHDG